MGGAILAFGRAVASQLHPRMLALLIVPFLVALVGWVVVAWFVWTPFTGWLEYALFDAGGPLSGVYEFAARFGAGALRGVLSSLLALLAVIPLMFATAVALIAVLATPLVTRHLGEGPYRDVARRGSWSIGASIWNAVSSLAIFAVCYLLTLPLWLIPPFALLIPWLLWSWLTARMLRFDSLVEHADPLERATLIARHRTSFLMLGALVTALNYVPPLFLVTPVLSALAFVHFSLARLREARTAKSAPAR